MRNRPPHRGLRPQLFTNSTWVLYRPKNFFLCQGCETGATIYRPYPRILRKSNRLQILVFAVSFFASVYVLVLRTFGYKKISTVKGTQAQKSYYSM